jgi:hypothetical protein
MSFMMQRTQEQARRTAAPAVRLSFEQSEFDADRTRTVRNARYSCSTIRLWVTRIATFSRKFGILWIICRAK